MTKEYKIKSLSKILLISMIVILLLGGTLIYYYYSISVTKSTETITVTETKTITTTIFLDTDGDGIPNYKEREYGTDPNKPNYLLAYALKKLPENEALKFKNVDNFNESSKDLIDYYASLSENVRNSKEVNELLNQILSDNIINELEKKLIL
jgi:flagellar basal body-associated protein FliL